MGTIPELGSQVLLDLGNQKKTGMLVMRSETRITVEVGVDGDPDHHSITLSPAMCRVETLSRPAPGKMLLMRGDRVIRLLRDRLETVDWLASHMPDWQDRGVHVVPADPLARTWHSPVPLRLVPDRLSEGFKDMPSGTTGIPIGADHPGAFGYRRRHHVHEGVDIYAPEGTPVHAVEDGIVVAVLSFTGSIARPPTPFWNDTFAVMVEGGSGVVLYGEIDPVDVSNGDQVAAGQTIGMVRRVLVKEKTPPRPMSMLHVELHRHGTTDAYEWPIEGPRPPSLLDPTEMLLSVFVDRR